MKTQIIFRVAHFLEQYSYNFASSLTIKKRRSEMELSEKDANKLIGGRCNADGHIGVFH